MDSFLVYNICMKIISLNTWCGRVGEPLHSFFEKYKDCDIFCLQEVDLDGNKFGLDVTGNGESNILKGDPNLFYSIDDILSDHHGYFSPALGSWWGNAIFIKKTLYQKVSAYGEIVVSDAQQQYVPYDTWFRRTIQWIDFKSNNKDYTLVNFHGLWEKDKGKNDSTDRLEQSENILKFLKTKKERNIILVGDFNLNPNTNSLKILENIPLNNLIKRYGIVDTRTSYYKKENRFADYALVSPSIDIKDFKVLTEEISDHAALYLEIE